MTVSAARRQVVGENCIHAVFVSSAQEAWCIVIGGVDQSAHERAARIQVVVAILHFFRKHVSEIDQSRDVLNVNVSIGLIVAHRCFLDVKVLHFLSDGI